MPFRVRYWLHFLVVCVIVVNVKKMCFWIRTGRVVFKVAARYYYDDNANMLRSELSVVLFYLGIRVLLNRYGVQNRKVYLFEMGYFDIIGLRGFRSQ